MRREVWAAQPDALGQLFQGPVYLVARLLQALLTNLSSSHKDERLRIQQYYDMPSDLYHRDRLVFLQDQGRRLVAVTGKFHRAVHVTLTSSVAVALGVVAKTSFTGMDAAVFILAWSIAVVLILGVLMFLAQMVARLARRRLANVSLSPTDDDSLKDKGRLRAI